MRDVATPRSALSLRITTRAHAEPSGVQGNKELYGDLVKRYQQMVFRICIGFLHQKEDADDLTQEIFIQAYQSLPDFKGISAFSTWLYRIAVNACLNKTRKKIFLFSLSGLFRHEEFSIPDPDDPEKMLLKDEQQSKIRNALDSLAENQRTAIVLSKYDDLPQKEIAEIMKITEGAVEALLQRAKANLRKVLTDEFQKKKKRP
jgi:RNA polymerase sigma-70 factor (ECF subfamily)